MNMISTGAFLNEMDASNKQPTLAETFAAVWEKKNAKAARAGGVSLMALSLAACGSSSTTTTSTSTTTTTTTTTPTAKSFALTLNEDSGASFTGGAGADSYTGKAMQNNAGTTSYPLQGFDSLDGGAGADTLDVTLNTTVAPTIKNIETITAKAVAASTLNMATSSGATKLVNADSTANMTFSNVAAVATVEISGLAGASDTTVGYASKVLDGTADSQSLILGGNTSMGAISLGEAGAKVETLNVSVSGKNVGTSLTSGAKDIVVTGAGDLKLTTAVTGNVDASAATGKMELTAAIDADTMKFGSGADKLTISDTAAVTVEATVTMGAGDDSVVISNLDGVADLVNTKFTLDGGEGKDTLTMINALADTLTDLTAANYAKEGISGFEKLVISDITTNDALDFTIMGISDIDLAAGQGADNTFTIANAGQIALGAAASAATDTATITVKGATDAGRNSDSFTLILDPAHAGGGVNLGEVTVANVETINIVANTAKTTALVAADVSEVDLIIANATTVTVTGSTGVDIDADPFDGVITNFDASALTGTLAVSFAGGAGVTAKGSATKANTIVGSSNADHITGGSAADTITPGAGKDVIVLGSDGKADTVKFAESATTEAGSISGFDVGTVDDIISVSIGNIAATGSGNDTLSNLGGTDINSAVAAGSMTAVSVTGTEGTVNIADATNLLVYTTAAATFAAAAGTSLIRDAGGDSSGLTSGTEGVMAVWYDSDVNQAVYGYIDDTDNAGNGLNKDDTFYEIARVDMASTDFTLANIDASISLY